MQLMVHIPFHVVFSGLVVYILILTVNLILTSRPSPLSEKSTSLETLR